MGMKGKDMGRHSKIFFKEDSINRCKGLILKILIRGEI